MLKVPKRRRAFAASGLRVLLLWLMVRVSFAQAVRVESVAAWASYSHALQLKSGQQLREVQGWGGGITVQLPIASVLSIGLQGDYRDLAIDQENAVEQWRWAFWERFYRNYVRDLQARDPSYSASLVPEQRLYLVELAARMNVHWPPKGKARVRLAFGTGPWFYTRTLRLHERWQKRFPELGHTFAYEYDNYAEERKGVVYGASVCGGVEVELQRYLRLGAEVCFGKVLRVRGSDYENFPVHSLGSLRCAVLFAY